MRRSALEAWEGSDFRDKREVVDGPGPSAWRRPSPTGSDFQRKFQRWAAKGETEARRKGTRVKPVTPRANHAKRKGGNLTGAGTCLPERGQALY